MSKPKKEKAPKEKKPKKEKAPEEGTEGKKKKKKGPLLIILALVVIAAVAAVVIFVVLPRLGGGEQDPEVEVSVEPQPPELPPEYQVGEETIVGMTLGADESEAKAEPAKTVVYTYTDLVDAGNAAKTYAIQLSSEKPAVYVVDEEFVRTGPPDFTAREGMVLLARDIVPEEAEDEKTEDDDAEDGDGDQTPPAAGPAKVLTVRMEWSEGVCVVTADEAEGTVTMPPMSSTSSVGGSGGRGGMTVGQMQDYLESIDPAKLGLSGTTMEEYEVFPMDGVVMVNDTPCVKLNVYSSDAQNNNRFMGSYLMSIDGSHLYQLDPATNEIKVLE